MLFHVRDDRKPREKDGFRGSMNIGQKALAFAVGAFFVVGVAAVATSAAGAPDTDAYEDDGIEIMNIEIVETDDTNWEAGDEATFDVEGAADIEAEETDARVDSYEGDADYYHVPVEAVDDDDYDHDFDITEVGRDADFAGADGFVVEAEEVDTDDPRVVAHVAENDPEVDGITRADELETWSVNSTSFDTTFDEEADEEYDGYNRTLELEERDGETGEIRVVEPGESDVVDVSEEAGE